MPIGFESDNPECVSERERERGIRQRLEWNKTRSIYTNHTNEEYCIHF